MPQNFTLTEEKKNIRMFLFTPANEFYGELEAYNIKIDLSLKKFSQLEFELPYKFFDMKEAEMVINHQLYSTLDMYQVEVWIGNVYGNQTEYEKMRFVIVDRPVSQKGTDIVYKYTAISLEHELKYIPISSWPGVERKYYKVEKAYETALSTISNSAATLPSGIDLNALFVYRKIVNRGTVNDLERLLTKSTIDGTGLEDNQIYAKLPIDQYYIKKLPDVSTVTLDVNYSYQLEEQTVTLERRAIGFSVEPQTYIRRVFAPFIYKFEKSISLSQVKDITYTANNMSGINVSVKFSYFNQGKNVKNFVVSDYTDFDSASYIQNIDGVVDEIRISVINEDDSTFDWSFSIDDFVYTTAGHQILYKVPANRSSYEIVDNTETLVAHGATNSSYAADSYSLVTYALYADAEIPYDAEPDFEYELDGLTFQEIVEDLYNKQNKKFFQWTIDKDSFDSSVEGEVRSQLKMDNTNWYDFLTKMGETFNIHVDFDTFNRRINFIHNDSLGQNNGLFFEYGKYLKGVTQTFSTSEMYNYIEGRDGSNVSFGTISFSGDNFLEDYSYYLDGAEWDSENDDITKSSRFLTDDLARILAYKKYLQDSYTEEIFGNDSRRGILKTITFLETEKRNRDFEITELQNEKLIWDRILEKIEGGLTPEEQANLQQWQTSYQPEFDVFNTSGDIIETEVPEQYRVFTLYDPDEGDQTYESTISIDNLNQGNGLELVQGLELDVEQNWFRKDYKGLAYKESFWKLYSPMISETTDPEGSYTEEEYEALTPVIDEDKLDAYKSFWYWSKFDFEGNLRGTGASGFKIEIDPFSYDYVVKNFFRSNKIVGLGIDKETSIRWYDTSVGTFRFSRISAGVEGGERNLLEAQLNTDSSSLTFGRNDRSVTFESTINFAHRVYYGSQIPTINNYPGQTWINDDLKNTNLGVYYYNSSNDQIYEFVKSGTTYLWGQINTTVGSGTEDDVELKNIIKNAIDIPTSQDFKNDFLDLPQEQKPAKVYLVIGRRSSDYYATFLPLTNINRYDSDVTFSTLNTPLSSSNNLMQLQIQCKKYQFDVDVEDNTPFGGSDIRYEIELFDSSNNVLQTFVQNQPQNSEYLSPGLSTYTYVLENPIANTVDSVAIRVTANNKWADSEYPLSSLVFLYKFNKIRFILANSSTLENVFISTYKTFAEIKQREMEIKLNAKITAFDQWMNNRILNDSTIYDALDDDGFLEIYEDSDLYTLPGYNTLVERLEHIQNITKWSDNDSEFAAYQNSPRLKQELIGIRRGKVYQNKDITDPYTLLQATKEYLDKNKYPNVQITIDTISILQSSELISEWSKVKNGDYITVYVPEIGVNIDAQIHQIKYDFEKRNMSISITNKTDYKPGVMGIIGDMFVRYNYDSKNLLYTSYNKWNTTGDTVNENSQLFDTTAGTLQVSTDYSEFAGGQVSLDIKEAEVTYINTDSDQITTVIPASLTNAQSVYGVNGGSIKIAGSSIYVKDSEGNTALSISAANGISSDNFRIDLDGNAYFGGELEAASGTFGSVSIDQAGSLEVGNITINQAGITAVSDLANPTTTQTLFIDSSNGDIFIRGTIQEGTIFEDTLTRQINVSGGTRIINYDADDTLPDGQDPNTIMGTFTANVFGNGNDLSTDPDTEYLWQVEGLLSVTGVTTNARTFLPKIATAYTNDPTQIILTVTYPDNKQIVEIIPINITKDGIQGVNGFNQAQIYLYKRVSGTAPANVGTIEGSHNFPNATTVLNTNSDSWSLTIPSGADPLYVSIGTVKSQSESVGFTQSIFSGPVVLVENGEDGVDGLNNATVYIYLRAESLPTSKPAGDTTYTFATGAVSFTNANGWSATPPTTGGKNLYFRIATAASTGATDTIADTEWSSVGLIASDGADGEPGSSGADARTIILKPSQYVINYDIDGTTESDTITFTVETNGTTGTKTYAFYVDGVEKQAASTTATFTLADSDEPLPGDSIVVEVELYEDSVFKAIDGVSIYGIKDGAPGEDGDDAVTGFLTNESHTVASENNGTGYILTGSGGTFKVFDGLTDKTGNGPTYSVVAPAVKNGLTMSINATTGIYTLSGASWTTDSETFILRATYNSLNIDKVYSITKSKKGVEGEQGTAAKVVTITPSTQAVVLKADGKTDGAQTITFTTETQGTLGTLTWSASANGAIQNVTTGTLTFADNTTYTFPMTVTFGDGTTQDKVTIIGVKPGANGDDAVNAFLTNETHTVAADKDGNVLAGEFTNATTEIKIFVGTTDDTSTWSITYNSTDMTLTNGDFPITAMSADSGTVTITGTKAGFSNVVKTFTVTKARQGIQGQQGLTGPQGAGVVYRGEWNSLATYTSSTIRRDVVKFSNNTIHPYWIAKESHTNQTPPASGNTATSYWETFGATFTSVATGLLLAEESVVQNTINVGTNDQGNANIAIVGGTNAPYISIGQEIQGYNNDGIFLGLTGDRVTDVISVSSPFSTTAVSVNSIGIRYFYATNFNGFGNIQINDKVLLTGSTASFEGIVTNRYSNQGGFRWIEVDITSGGGTGQTWVVDTIQPKSSLKSNTNSLTWDGTNLTVTGAVYADSGDIGGWVIGQNSLKFSNSNFVSDFSPDKYFVFEKTKSTMIQIAPTRGATSYGSLGEIGFHIEKTTSSNRSYININYDTIRSQGAGNSRLLLENVVSPANSFFTTTTSMNFILTSKSFSVSGNQTLTISVGHTLALIDSVNRHRRAYGTVTGRTYISSGNFTSVNITFTSVDGVEDLTDSVSSWIVHNIDRGVAESILNLGPDSSTLASRMIDLSATGTVNGTEGVWVSSADFNSNTRYRVDDAADGSGPSTKIIKTNIRDIEDQKIENFIDKTNIKIYDNLLYNKTGISLIIEDEEEKNNPFKDELFTQGKANYSFKTLPEFLVPYENDPEIIQKHGEYYYFTPKSYNKDNFMGLMMASIKHNNQKIKELEKENSKLKQDIEDIKNHLGL